MELMVVFGVLIVVLCGYLAVVDMLADSRFFKRDLAIARQLARKCRAGITRQPVRIFNAACVMLPLGQSDVAAHIHERVGLFMRLHAPHPGHKS